MNTNAMLVHISMNAIDWVIHELPNIAAGQAFVSHRQPLPPLALPLTISPQT